MDFMKNFDDGKDEGFFIPIDIPLSNRQVDLLYDLLIKNLERNIFDQIKAVGHDGYGSFKIFTKPGVDRTDELKEIVWEAGEELFMHLEMLKDIDADNAQATISQYVNLHYEVLYNLPKPNELIAELVEYGLPEEEVGNAVFVELLKGEAA